MDFIVPLLFGAVIGLLAGGLIGMFFERPKVDPVLYRYTVQQIGFPAETVDAADANTDELDVQTVHFFDHDGNVIAIYHHVLKVTSLKAPTNV